ncbi:MAG: hypothetical protein ABW221_25360, partial [Vicinamibacteria bacterium]
SPLVAPPLPHQDGARLRAAAERLAAQNTRGTGRRADGRADEGWLGIDCPSVGAAVWMMRALVACNVLSRREETVLFVPAGGRTDPDGRIAAGAVARVHRLAAVRGVC